MRMAEREWRGRIATAGRRRTQRKRDGGMKSQRAQEKGEGKKLSLSLCPAAPCGGYRWKSVHGFVGLEVQSVEQRFFDFVNFGPPIDLHVDAVAVGGGNFENRRFAVLVGEADFDGGFGELRRDRARRLVVHFGGLPFIVFLFGHERDVGVLDVDLRQLFAVEFDELFTAQRRELSVEFLVEQGVYFEELRPVGNFGVVILIDFRADGDGPLAPGVEPGGDGNLRLVESVFRRIVHALADDLRGLGAGYVGEQAADLAFISQAGDWAFDVPIGIFLLNLVASALVDDLERAEFIPRRAQHQAVAQVVERFIRIVQKIDRDERHFLRAVYFGVGRQADRVLRAKLDAMRRAVFEFDFEFDRRLREAVLLQVASRRRKFALDAGGDQIADDGVHRRLVGRRVDRLRDHPLVVLVFEVDRLAAANQ